MRRLAATVAAGCPEGVAYRPLKDLARLRNGKSYNSLGPGSVPVYGSGGVMTHVARSAYDKPSVLIPRKGSLGNLFYVDEPFWNVDTIFYTEVDEELMLPKFLYYALSTMRLAEMNHAGGVPSQTQSALNELRLPVPPLEVQAELVGILDQMSALMEELEAELAGRRRQYTFYAELLLSTGEEVPRVRLGDLATIVRGASPRPIQSFFCKAEDGYPWIKIGDVPSDGKYITRTAQYVTPAGAAKSRRVRPGDFVLSNSMSFGRPYISKIDGYIHDGWLAISDFSDSFDPNYLYYLLRSAAIQTEFGRRAGSGTVKNLNADIVKSIEVPVPSMEQQTRVVELLNNFDMLVNDPDCGLPVELAARKKQFGYYRDRLFAFPLSSAEAASG
jgi:type I restriction enzyme S subunit